MREIKFRAWDNDAQCFTYSGETEEHHGEYVWGFEDGKVKAWVVAMQPATRFEPEQPEAIELEPPPAIYRTKSQRCRDIRGGYC